MAKDKQLSIRTDESLYEDLKRLADQLKLNVTTLSLIALNFLRRNPKQVMESEIQDSVEKEYIEMDNTPEWTLERIKKYGITKKSELWWIANSVRNAWYRFDNTATAPWVAKLTEVLRLLVHATLKKDVVDYLQAEFPEKSNDLNESIEVALSNLASKDQVKASYAVAIAKCVVAVVKEKDFLISAETMTQIQELLSPWSVWVARRSLLPESSAKDIDITPLLIFQKQEKETFRIDKDYVHVEVFLPGGLFSGFRDADRFSCGFTILDVEKQKNKVTFACTSETLNELVQAANLLEKGKRLAGFGHWEVMNNDESDTYYIQKYGVQVSVLKHELREFLALVKELYQDADVRRAVALEHVEKYGAL